MRRASPISWLAILSLFCCIGTAGDPTQEELLPPAPPSQAEVYRFQPWFLSEVSLALGIEPELDENNVLTFSEDEVARRFPAAVRIGFDVLDDLGDGTLTFPDDVVAVIGVKRTGGTLRDTLLVPLEHVGGGTYRIPQESEAARVLAGWIVAHSDQVWAGQAVIERVDDLHRELKQLNPDATVALSMHLLVAGQRWGSGLKPSYKRLPKEFMDSFPEEFWEEVRSSGPSALRQELMLREAEQSGDATEDVANPDHPTR